MHQELPEAGEKPAIQWVSARHLQYMVTRAESAGVNMDTLLAEAGLVRARLPDVNYQVPVDAVEYLLANAHLLRQPGQPSAVDMPIGLFMAREIQPATFGAIGLIAQACASFADVLDILTRFNGLLSNIGRTTVIHKPGTVSLCWECTAGGPHFRRHTADYVLAAFVTLCRLLMSGQKLAISSVHFPHNRPVDARALQVYADIFQAPLHFDSTMASVVMPASMLQMPLCHGDALLKETLERHAQQTLQLMQQRSPGPSLIDEVTHLIRAMMIGQVPDKDAIARQLGISSRSLHRRLQASGTRYRDLLDQVRLTVAQERLTDSTSPLAHIAEHLGFSSRQAFIRWFREQTGNTPGAWRQQQPD